MNTRASAAASTQVVYPILLAISFSHLLNDTIQSLIPAIYPMVKEAFRLSFAQIGYITLTFQLSSSILQPFVGIYTDRKPFPYALPVGMGFSLAGLLIMSVAWSFPVVLFSVALIGMGSSVFHPEASRLAHMASGGKNGLAQSVFQVGGNMGSAIGPLLAALIIAPFGQFNVIWFSLAALLAMVVLYRVALWYKPRRLRAHVQKRRQSQMHTSPLPKPVVTRSVLILMLLIFSKYFYMASITSYYTFYLMDKFHISVQSSQIHLFIFLLAAALGTLMGGPLGDRFGRKYVIWFSIFGAAPFALLLPYTSLVWTTVLSVLIGLIISSAFSAILVYAQELMPGKIGMISGIFFGFAFGMGGIGSAVLGNIADHSSIAHVYAICSYLPLLGLIAAFLPNVRQNQQGG